ncbi:MAG TPA: isochorismatase family cysteine hydrolase [Blastocatellia bacterium]|nr:isochorismatase family cysteine hydrolase [Blastocatellia bacterium]HMX24131.1 isochorismatase family cysteine hydrolase [Blastocatellia bacterium]HMY70519.1 isochorismatase family cysteine hydrolase [Blastocatellia bacterium]HMZ21269.1 isochorismatase family cysteine hydrolase [Blastocatellia bacterium]HNG30766.1 isochorismatase family cysteine hydrolase [Blastocatellia bacterium]
MPPKNEDLHGNVPDTSAVVLLLIDVINDLEFVGGDALLKFALPAAERIAELKQRAKQLGIPAIYVNDNFGKWQSDFRKLVAHCLNDGVSGEPLARLLAPEEHDYFVLKPKHSGFYSTTLELLLEYLRAKTLILTGLTGDVCVLFTAHDAFLRDFNLLIPGDCIASIDQTENQHALKQMQRVLKADTRPSMELDLNSVGK